MTNQKSTNIPTTTPRRRRRRGEGRGGGNEDEKFNNLITAIRPKVFSKQDHHLGGQHRSHQYRFPVQFGWLVI